MPRPSLSSVLVAAAAAVTIPACVTARAAVGPNLSSGGSTGVSATGGLGLGWSFADHQAIYVAPNAGVVTLDHARAVVFSSVSYVHYGLALPVRVDARLGSMLGRARYDQDGRALVGGAIAILPWHGRSPDHHHHSEKGWDIGPDLDVLRGLGIEVAVDALPAPSADERGLVLTTISLVGDLGIMMAP